MNIKINLLVFLILISSTIAQTNTDLKQDIDLEKCINQINQRFLLNGDTSLNQIASFFHQSDINFSSGPESSLWLIDNYTFQKWNSSSWQNDSSQIFNYNEQNLISERRIRDWISSQWMDKCRYLYSYDQSLRKGNQTFQVYLSNSWIDSLKNRYDYNSQGLLSTITTYHWKNQTWENWELMTSTYSNNQILQDVYQNWDGSSWENSQRTYYEYFSNSINITFDLWLLGTWINFLRIVANYGTNGFLSELKIQIWIPFVGWTDLTRTLFTYDTNYNIIEGITQVWDDNTSFWVNNSRATSTYTSDNLPKTVLNELWTDNSYWKNDFLRTHNYDVFLNRLETVGQRWAGNNWINSEREAFTYIDVLPVETTNQAPDEFKLIGNYPNPFNPTTTIIFHIPHTSEVILRIYNSIGEEVAKLINNELAPGTYDIIWNAKVFTSGVYYYQLYTNGFVETKKMILLK